MADQSGKESRDFQKPLSSKKTSPLAKDIAATVDRLSQPKHRKNAARRTRLVERERASREDLEMGYPVSTEEQFVNFSSGSLSRVNLNEEDSLKNIAEFEDDTSAKYLSPTAKSSTNLARVQATSVERLSRPKSRKKAMHQNRLSLNLDEQWKSLAEAFQSGLQQASSPEKTESGFTTPSSSRESICSQSTNASFGSKSSVFGSRIYGRDAVSRSKLSCTHTEKQRNRSSEVSYGRRKAKSERLLLSMDNLNSASPSKGGFGSKSLSPGCAIQPTQTTKKSQTASVDRLPVMSRLTAPTVSSSLKHRVASETKLKLERSASNMSLSSKVLKGSQKKLHSSSGLSSKKEDRFGIKLSALSG